MSLRPRLLGALVTLFGVSLASASRADTKSGCSRLMPWNRVGASLGHYIEPTPLILTGLSPVPVLALAPTGLDHELRLVAQEDLGGAYRVEPVSLWAPYVLAGSAVVGLGVAALLDACEVERPLSAIVQAMAGGLIVTGVLKWSVGREWPNGGQDPRAPDRLEHPEYAQEFRPFGWRFGAWPSGHTLSMFAAAAAFRAAERELGVVRFVGYPLALGVGFGLWMSDHHWTSDVLSGALLGEAIGGSVGKSFARSEDRPATAFGSPFVVPVGGGALVGWAGEW